MRLAKKGSLAYAALLGSLALAASASAATKTVCASGCPFQQIQPAIDAATPGTVITIGTGKYFENLVVDKSVTLRGAGLETIVYPSSSKPECAGGSLCGGTASNGILVEADGVTITNLWLEGDNPNLTSGVERGGADIDARNGIITNHETGVFNGLVVSRVKVSDVFLRGIYASSGGTFKFTHDTVDNVQGNEASIGIFAFEGAGEMTADKVTRANDAISANWSKGIKFTKNVVLKSGSGIHTDNNGGSGGEADLIQGNTIRECKADGYGIFVFVPYVSATVEANKVAGCAVGLAAFGGAVSGEGPTFANNVLNGTGAAASGATYGAYLTTDELGFGFGDLAAVLSGNRFSHFSTGLLATQTSPSPGQSAGGQATIAATPNNSFVANGTGANGEPGTVVNAAEDWWGCESGPNMGHMCNTAVGTVTYLPFRSTRP
jgi:hypothetical protein